MSHSGPKREAIALLFNSYRRDGELSKVGVL